MYTRVDKGWKQNTHRVETSHKDLLEKFQVSLKNQIEQHHEAQHKAVSQDLMWQEKHKDEGDYCHQQSDHNNLFEMLLMKPVPVRGRCGTHQPGVPQMIGSVDDPDGQA